MSLPLTFFCGSLLTLLTLALLFRIEEKKGRRLVLAGVRRGFDDFLLRLKQRVKKFNPYLGEGFLRLIFHYFAHTLLRRLLRMVRSLEQWIESLVRHNRKAARSIESSTTSSTHLQAIAEHKVETALTEREKRRLRNKG